MQFASLKATVDLVLATDVIEHIENDDKAINEIQEFLKRSLCNLNCPCI